MTDFFKFKEILDNQAVRGENKYGEVVYEEDKTRINRIQVKLVNQNVIFIFSLDGRFMGVKNLSFPAVL